MMIVKLLARKERREKKREWFPGRRQEEVLTSSIKTDPKVLFTK
jgi:hypothetical protein